MWQNWISFISLPFDGISNNEHMITKFFDDGIISVFGFVQPKNWNTEKKIVQGTRISVSQIMFFLFSFDVFYYFKILRMIKFCKEALPWWKEKKTWDNKIMFDKLNLNIKNYRRHLRALSGAAFSGPPIFYRFVLCLVVISKLNSMNLKIIII